MTELQASAKFVRKPKLPFSKKLHRSGELLGIVHTDVCEPMRNESRGKAKYLLTLTDDFSRWMEIRFLRKKSEALQSFNIRLSPKNIQDEK